jgi:hypothetical protein
MQLLVTSLIIVSAKNCNIELVWVMLVDLSVFRFGWLLVWLNGHVVSMCVCSF